MVKPEGFLETNDQFHFLQLNSANLYLIQSEELKHVRTGELVDNSRFAKFHVIQDCGSLRQFLNSILAVLKVSGVQRMTLPSLWSIHHAHVRIFGIFLMIGCSFLIMLRTLMMSSILLQPRNQLNVYSGLKCSSHPMFYVMKPDKEF